MYLMSYSSTLEAVWKYSVNWGLAACDDRRSQKTLSIGRGYRLPFLFLGHKKQLGEITLKESQDQDWVFWLLIMWSVLWGGDP